MRWLLPCLAGLLALSVAACKKSEKASSKAAIQAAIEAHLEQQRNLTTTNMTLEFEEVKFSGDAAQALVKFRSKQSPELAVTVRYVLRKIGDRWQVESSTPEGGMGGTPHGSVGGHPSNPPPQTDLQSSH